MTAAVNEHVHLPAGPIVPPGRYRMKLVVGEQTLEEEFEVHKDPRIAVPDSDFVAQFELLQ